MPGINRYHLSIYINICSMFASERLFIFQHISANVINPSHAFYILLILAIKLVCTMVQLLQHISQNQSGSCDV